MSRSSSASMMTRFSSIKPEDYKHSPVHYALVLGDHLTLTRLLSTLPKLADPAHIHSEADSLSQERLANQISAVIDRRDVPFRETPLHLAVRLNDSVAARTLAAAGADVSLQNAAGWNPLQEALCRHTSEIAMLLLKLHHRSAWCKWRRRLPRVIAVLRRMRDFYMEISFHFESSVIPFVGKIAPSDTYKIWKRDGNLRADTSLAGFDGLKIQRADQSFLFLGDGDHHHNIPSGSLLVLNHDDGKIFDALENAGVQMSESEITGFCSQTSVYRPGMDVTRAELVGRTNWRRQEKIESVGEWKAKVYELHNVIFSFRSRKVASSGNDNAGSEQVLPLELDEDEDGFLVCENPNFAMPDSRRHSSFVREDREWISVGRKSVDVVFPSSAAPPRRSVTFPMTTAVPPPQTKEKEYVRSLRPSVWLTEQFPLKTEELLPLLDILANKVKAVRRMRELLTTKFPPGTFPVKLAIPVVPTVRVVITFTKFVELRSTDQFYTPLSSPSLFSHGGGRGQAAEDPNSDNNNNPWFRQSNGRSVSMSKHQQQQRGSSSTAHLADPFAIPSGYTWTSVDDKCSKLKKSKSTRK
ncbi:hypothetical protein like AT1G62050 [Hibiscus trionum]|uniref:Ankyrin repeat domain-containing protein n=1 Tax=Hibiscus trionum TaxID=183268 RepID=A0A9W7I8W6_HIBTR|nr:hypothetical protein like AT1G62050 [Hibiscus trionum]